MTNYELDGTQINHRVRKWSNYHHIADADPEIPIGKSETKPGMTLTMREILKRFASGQELPGFPVGYDDPDSDDFFPDLNRYSKIELHEMALRNGETIMEHYGNLKDKSDANKAKAEKAKAEKDAADAAELENFRKGSHKTDPH